MQTERFFVSTNIFSCFALWTGPVHWWRNIWDSVSQRRLYSRAFWPPVPPPTAMGFYWVVGRLLLFLLRYLLCSYLLLKSASGGSRNVAKLWGFWVCPKLLLLSWSSAWNQPRVKCGWGRILHENVEKPHYCAFLIPLVLLDNLKLQSNSIFELGLKGSKMWGFICAFIRVVTLLMLFEIVRLHFGGLISSRYVQ